MFFLNLSAFEFFALLGTVSSFVVALYLLSRSRRKQVVPTLKFWVSSQQPVANQQRRRIQQPWSLLLQLISICLLLLAIAQLRLGSRETSSRDHVLLLDTSSWMAARSGSRTLLDEAKRRAHAFIRALPSTDRVMVVRADGVATPATGMVSDRAAIHKAIDDSRPGAAALNLEQAFSFGEQVRRLHSQNAGELVFVGASRLAANGVPTAAPKGLRVIPAGEAGANAGLTKIALRRSSEDPAVWQAFVSVRNYGTSPQSVPVVLHFGGAPQGSRRIDVPAGRTADAQFAFRTRAAGWIEARLLVSDALAEDDRALVELPGLEAMKVVVYSSEPDLLRPALAAHPQINVAFRRPSEYAPGNAADGTVVILDRFVPPQPPAGAAIWIHPPARSPFPVRARAADAPIVRWQAGHEIAAGLRTRQLRLPSTDVFAMSAGDVAVAEVAAGPVIVARPKSRTIAMGFHPGADALRYELATPLLLANTLRWLSPEVFRGSELVSGTVGAVSVPLASDIDPAGIRVIGDKDELPFTVQGRTLRFFSGSPDRVRVMAAGSEQVHSLSLPEVGLQTWAAPASARRGVPARTAQAFSRDIWPLLALLGLAGLLAEWLLYGHSARRRPAPAPAESGEPRTWRQAS